MLDIRDRKRKYLSECITKVDIPSGESEEIGMSRSYVKEWRKSGQKTFSTRENVQG